MRSLTLILLAAATLAGCSWETYQTAEGRTALRQKYQNGTSVYYQDGTYSRNMNYNQFRPEQHAIRPAAQSEEENVRGTVWQKPAPAGR